MSFSSEAKNEMIHQPLGKPCCMLNELGALLQTSASLSLQGGGRLRVTYRMESAALAKRVFLLLRGRLEITPTVHYIQHARLGGQRQTLLTLENDDAQKLLLALHMMETGEDGALSFRRTTPRHPMTRSCCRRAFLRGAFLGGGTVVNPDKAYTLEFFTREEELAQTLMKLLEKAELAPRQTMRRDKRVIYFKQSQQVADLLTLMGAPQATLKLENAKLRKNLRNQVNRSVNCDQSNLEKQLDAAQLQIEAIKDVSLKKGLTWLPPALEQIARLRLVHPEATLAQLGDMLEPPVGKSGVNHRLRRIMALAEEMNANPL